jgi:hypothetical protein
MAQIQQANPNQQIDDKMKEQIIESVWSQLINDKVLKVQYKKLGISVSDDELYDLMLSSPSPICNSAIN